jgi:hypothetical protein
LAVVDVAGDIIVFFVRIAPLVANRARELPGASGSVTLVAVTVMWATQREPVVEIGLGPPGVVRRVAELAV